MVPRALSALLSHDAEGWPTGLPVLYPGTALADFGDPQGLLAVAATFGSEAWAMGEDAGSDKRWRDHLHQTRRVAEGTWRPAGRPPEDLADMLAPGRARRRCPARTGLGGRRRGGAQAQARASLRRADGLGFGSPDNVPESMRLLVPWAACRMCWTSTTSSSAREAAEQLADTAVSAVGTQRFRCRPRQAHAKASTCRVRFSQVFPRPVRWVSWPTKATAGACR